jgi:hypothetical protein
MIRTHMRWVLTGPERMHACAHGRTPHEAQHTDIALLSRAFWTGLLVALENTMGCLFPCLPAGIRCAPGGLLGSWQTLQCTSGTISWDEASRPHRNSGDVPMGQAGSVLAWLHHGGFSLLACVRACMYAKWCLTVQL